jgi:hypothetical protein
MFPELYANFMIVIIENIAMLQQLTRRCSKLVLVSIVCLLLGMGMKMGGPYLEPTASILIGISGIGFMMSIFAEAIG